MIFIYWVILVYFGYIKKYFKILKKFENDSFVS